MSTFAFFRRGLAQYEDTLISKTAEYALRAVVFLGRDRDRAWTTQQVAAGTRVPEGYLSKVLQALVRARIIQSVRGIYGGYQLARPPSEVSALDVINSVDPIRRIRCCPLGLEEHESRRCPLHRRVDAVAELAEQALADTKISELVPVTRAGADGRSHDARPREGASRPAGVPRAKRATAGNKRTPTPASQRGRRPASKRRS